MSSSISKSNVVPAIAAPNDQNPPAFISEFFRLPVLFYRLGLGWMFGKRFMLLTHVGRRSGKVYQSVLAVVKFDPESGEIQVVSPWNSSNWFHNIQASAALEVQTAGMRYVPVQRFLSPKEIAALFIQFRRAHPIFSRIIARIPGWKIDSTYDKFLELARSLRGVAFTPKADQSQSEL